MTERIETFLKDLDDTLAPVANGRELHLYHIGRSALVWQYGSTATTEDFDVLVPDGENDLLRLALAEFGEGSRKAAEHGMYLEQVPEVLPPVPAGYEKRAIPKQGNWKVVRLFHLDPHDFAVTKLRRFYPRDREDIRFMCDNELITAEPLKEALDKAFRWNLEKDGDEFRDAAYRHYEIVRQYLAGTLTTF